MQEGYFSSELVVMLTKAISKKKKSLVPSNGGIVNLLKN